MNPNDYELYDLDNKSVASVFTCRACGSQRFCTCTVLDYSTPMACPCGRCPEWRMRPTG